MEWILNNWGTVVAVGLAILALFKTADWFRYVRAVKRIAQAAWRLAEEEGITKKLKGAQKAAPFLEAFFRMWEEKFGELPDANTQALAMKTAAEESAAHKVDLGKSSTTSAP